MKKLLILPVIALMMLACEKDEDVKPEPKSTPEPTYNTEIVVAADTAISYVSYSTNEGDIEIDLDINKSTWSIRHNYDLGKNITLGISVADKSIPIVNINYTGSGILSSPSTHYEPSDGLYTYSVQIKE